MKKKTGIACIIALMALTISAAAVFAPTLESKATAKVVIKSHQPEGAMIKRSAEPELLAKVAVTKNVSTISRK